MKIDLVYLWVDGSDEKWQKKKNDTLKMFRYKLMCEAASENRFRDNNELKYSLRSVEKFAPWINHIYIVTDNQKPKWLADHPQVSIVDHKEIIPVKYLPTFNSAAIDMFVHKIPTLSEHFLYANDDMFFGYSVSPDFFFDREGNPVVIVKERHNPSYVFGNEETFKIKMAGKKMGRILMTNGVRYAYMKTGFKHQLYMCHSIEPMRKSHLDEIMEKYGHDLLSVTATTFREATNINRIVFPLILNAWGLNTLVLRYRFGTKRIVYSKSEMLAAKLLRPLRLKLFGANYDCYDRPDLTMMHKLHPAMMCINDVGNDVEEIQKFLCERFPEKSQFEI